jgi:hypothetical protein
MAVACGPVTAGRIYEHFLGTFAMSEGQKGGEFFTPTSIVRLIVEVIEPFHGRIRDEVTWYEGARRGTFDPVPLSQIGRLLIGLRIAHGLTQRQLAERLAVTQPVVSRDERNEYRGITIERVRRILDALNQAVSATVEAPAEGRTLAGVG